MKFVTFSNSIFQATYSCKVDLAVSVPTVEPVFCLAVSSGGRFSGGTFSFSVAIPLSSLVGVSLPWLDILATNV